jgi:hypothetical protein
MARYADDLPLRVELCDDKDNHIEEVIALVSDISADFEQHGPAVIEKVREERPHDCLKVAAALVPKQLEIVRRLRQRQQQR